MFPRKWPLDDGHSKNKGCRPKTIRTALIAPFEVLLTKVKSLDDSAVTLDINLLQIHKQLATLTNQTQQ